MPDSAEIEAQLARLSDDQAALLRVRLGVHDGVPKTARQAAEALGMDPVAYLQAEKNAFLDLRGGSSI